MDYKATFKLWQDALAGSEYQAELEKMVSDEKLMEDSFYQYLEFGTAGMRGTLSLGTNRMNVFTVRRCTQGLADYVKSCGNEEKGVVVAYDSRNYSR